MAVLDIRIRSGYLFLGVVVGHLLLISAQVNTHTGVPVVEAPLEFNRVGAPVRINRPAIAADKQMRAHPIRINHVVYMMRDAEEARATFEPELGSAAFESRALGAVARDDERLGRDRGLQPPHEPMLAIEQHGAFEGKFLCVFPRIVRAQLRIGVNDKEAKTVRRKLAREPADLGREGI